MRIVIGFTQSALPEYSSFDGYREGAEQKVITIDVDETAMDIEHVAEQCYLATNYPEPETLTGMAHEIFHAIYFPHPAYVRSLSVGDTVELPERGERVSCEAAGWQRLGPAS
jgi:hypothetical protein